MPSNPERGTLAVPPKETQKATLGMDAAFELPPQTILLVDDEMDILESLRVLFEASLGNVQVETAESASAALERLGSGPLDLVISDYKMPGMNGLEFLRECQRRLPNTPRILMTAYPDLDIGLRAIREAAIENFVTKPFDTAHLLCVVGAVLYARRAEELRKRSYVRSFELLGVSGGRT